MGRWGFPPGKPSPGVHGPLNDPGVSLGPAGQILERTRGLEARKTQMAVDEGDVKPDLNQPGQFPSSFSLPAAKL